jgi:hypothetical protein
MSSIYFLVFLMVFNIVYEAFNLFVQLIAQKKHLISKIMVMVFF